MKRRTIFLAVLAAALVLVMGIGSAFAYFTATTSAAGSITISLEPRTEIHEPDVINGVKHIVITNEEDAEPAWVRAQVFAGASAGELTVDGSGWTDGGDGWYYYDAILEPGGQTEELLVTISRLVDTEDAPEEGDNFNVVVVYESTLVLYDEAGEAYADWDLILDAG